MFISKKYAVPIGYGNSIFLVMEKSWKIIVEKSGHAGYWLTLLGRDATEVKMTARLYASVKLSNLLLCNWNYRHRS